jgi:hypothetical protein
MAQRGNVAIDQIQGLPDFVNGLNGITVNAAATVQVNGVDASFDNVILVNGV